MGCSSPSAMARVPLPLCLKSAEDYVLPFSHSIIWELTLAACVAWSLDHPKSQLSVIAFPPFYRYDLSFYFLDT